MNDPKALQDVNIPGPDDLTQDTILGGRVTMWQPRQGYRAGVDPVFLAAGVLAQPGDSVLDLGCGAGAASLCLAARVPGVRITGVERQPRYGALARRNGVENGVDLDVEIADLANMSLDLRQRRFHHIMANPPYFRRDASIPADDVAREGAHGEQTPLADWVSIAAKRCLPKGYVTFIYRTERLPELMNAFSAHLGSLELLPLIPRTGREAQLVLLRGRKEGRAAFRLRPGLVVHNGSVHNGDRADYSADARAILFEAGTLGFCG